MRKNIFILLSILVLCVLILAGINLSKKIKKASKPKVIFDKDKVDSFVIDSKQGNFTFVKESGEWSIEALDKDDGIVKKYRGDQGTINSFIEKTSRLELLDIVTENKDRFAEFEVNEASGTRVKLYKGKKLLASFIMGKYWQIDYQKSYFRFPDKNQVWTAKGLEPWLFTRDKTSWRDKAVMKIPKERITQIEIKYPEKPKDNVLLSRVSDYWLIGGTDKKANAEKVNNMVNMLTDLSTDDFAGKDKNFVKTMLEINIKTDSSTENLIFSDKITSQYPFKRNHSEPTYLMYEFRFTSLKLTKSDLLK